MKKVNNSIKMLIAGTAVVSAILFNSCSKDMQNKSTIAQGSSIDNSVQATPTPIAKWLFDSSWTESIQHLVGVSHKAKFTSTTNAYSGIAAFNSPDSGFVTYQNAGKLSNLTTGLAADFWVYANPKTGGAQCIWCLPQTGAFWPTQHVLLDGYSTGQKDTGLIKVMFKANRNIPYNEEWTVVGGIPHFYYRWSHIQYSYDGSTSIFTLIVNGKKWYQDTLMTDSKENGGVPLGNIVANPAPYGVVIGAFQNTWKPALFGDPQPWMLGFKGRIDQLKIYNKPVKF